MYDVRQFKPALYLLLALGMVGFGLAAEEFGLVAAALVALAVNGFLVYAGRFKPMSHTIAGIVTIVALLFVLHEYSISEQSPVVIIIGEFLMLLQVIKLYEQRGNRDYGQLLILGLLLMVAAAISTPSLAFAFILTAYLFLSLYCCLLFHLKVEADSARRALSSADLTVTSATLRQDQRFFTRSMRRLVVLATLTSVFFGVVIFLLFPRDTGAGMLGPVHLRAAPSMTGFSERVGFDQVARIQQDTRVIAYARVWKDDVPVTGKETLVLRGITLDHYNTATDTGAAPWQWVRSSAEEQDLVVPPHSEASLSTSDSADGAPRQTGRIRQEITLQPTGTKVLFAIAGPTSITSHRRLRLQFSPYDGVIETIAPLMDALEYEVESRDSLDPSPGAGAPSFTAAEADPKIIAYARRPEVCGVNAAGVALAQLRQPHLSVDPLDAQIAANIEHHLRSTFKYTLDLTSTTRAPGVDPLVSFLYDFKKGHCEYFAGAMTRLCQSLGMQARMVVGFKCDEYNELGSHYIVRQSDAHAWVEVHTAEGWKSYDPTSNNDVDAANARASFMSRLRHMLDFAEYTYGKTVIAYDNEQRDSIIQGAASRLRDAMQRFARWRKKIGGVHRWVNSVPFWTLSSTLMGVVIYAILLAGVVALVIFAHEKWTLRRRARRIGIGTLPAAEQRRLARQLGFYDNLILMLGKHRIERSRHLTPMEFADSLLYLPSDTYNRIRRLTQIFYRVRYGANDLSAAQQRHLHAVLEQISKRLETKKS